MKYSKQAIFARFHKLPRLRFQDRQLSSTLVMQALQRERFPRLPLDFDGSVVSTRAHDEGTAVGYHPKKERGAQLLPLALHRGPNRAIPRCPASPRQRP